MSSPQRNHLKENNSQKITELDCASVDLLNKVKQLKESLDAQQTGSQTKVSHINNIENTNTENQPNDTMLQQQTPFEMMKHCGLVDELNMYDQYVGQQLDSSSASSKTEEMPISSNSPHVISQPASPVSEAGGQFVGAHVNSNDLQLNSSHNSGVSGRQSVCSNQPVNQCNQLNELAAQGNQLTPTTNAVNVNILLNNVVSTASSMGNSNTSPAIAAQQLANHNPANSNFLSELSALMAAAAANNHNNQNSNRPESANHQQPANVTPVSNAPASVNNPLAGLNGLNLLSSLTNASPINQIATLLAGNAASSTVNQQMLLQQAANLGKVSLPWSNCNSGAILNDYFLTEPSPPPKLSGFNLSTNELHEQLQQLQQQQFQQQLSQIQQFLFLNQLNQQPNLSALSSIAPLGQMLSSLPQNLQAILQNTVGSTCLSNCIQKISTDNYSVNIHRFTRLTFDFLFLLYLHYQRICLVPRVSSVRPLISSHRHRLSSRPLRSHRAIGQARPVVRTAILSRIMASICHN